jgi:hypothetical protein
LRELSLHLLDIAENSIAAGAKRIKITVAEDTAKDTFFLSVEDDGKGMDAETVQKVVDPFVTSRTTRKVGLGIPLLKEAAEACNGWLKIESNPGAGTRIDVQFQRSHIDRMPLGDFANTCLILFTGNPSIHWIFQYSFDQRDFIFDDEGIKKELGDFPITEPSMIRYFRELFTEGVSEVKAGSKQELSGKS